MEDHPGSRVTHGDGVGQRVAGQLGAQVLGHGEPHDPARREVDHGR
jgi:hypothetical protein